MNRSYETRVYSACRVATSYTLTYYCYASLRRGRHMRHTHMLIPQSRILIDSSITRLSLLIRAFVIPLSID